MFGRHARTFIINWFALLLFGMTSAVVGLGYNSITNSISLPGGLRALGDMFGGSTNLLGLLGAFIALLIVSFAAGHLAKTDYSQRSSAVSLIGVVAVIALLLIGSTITIDGDIWSKIWIGGLGIVFVTLFAAFLTPRIKQSTTRS